MMVPIPEGWETDDRDGVLTLKRRWFSVTHGAALVFSLFWNGFLVVWYWTLSTASGQGDGGVEPGLLMAYLFPLLHLAVGLGLFYYSIAGFVNKTTIQISSDKLVLFHSPLPWPGNVSVDAREVRQLYVQEVTSSTKNGQSVSYTVKAILHSRREITFEKGLGDKSQALYLEKMIEDRLAIRDEAVLGEVGKERGGGAPQ